MCFDLRSTALQPGWRSGNSKRRFQRREPLPLTHLVVYEKMGRNGENWAEVVDRLVEGDQVAFLKLSRLVTGFLIQRRAYDFREEWPDLIQEVLLALVKAVRRDGIRERSAVVAYTRRITLNKLADRIRDHLRLREDQALPWDEEDIDVADIPHLSSNSRADVIVDVRRALAKLPEKQRKVVFAVYGEQKTYEQASAETGIPLGSVKRYLRDSLAELRRIFPPVPE
jgi:RNA polymerase sigma-70 factor (ECF subfamily)